MSLLSILTRRLRQLRQSRGLTQEEFAERAGVGYKFYQQIEAGRKKQIWLETVERLAAGFGLEVWQLLAPGEEPAVAVKEPAATYAEGRRKSGRAKRAKTGGKKARG